MKGYIFLVFFFLEGAPYGPAKMLDALRGLLQWSMILVVIQNLSSADPDCDITFSSRELKEGKFHSPDWPRQYLNNKRCVYRFVGLSNERVKIRFNVFNLQGMSPDCRYDYIDIYIQLKNLEESLLEAPVLGRFCGDSLDNLPRLIISTHNIIVLIFLSDETKNDAGFEGTFAFIDASIYNIGTLTSPNSCSYSINSKDKKTGYIVSPTFPGIYPDNLDCTYEFQGLPGERIKLTFEDFSIFHGGNYCPFDYLLIKDGMDKNYSEDIGVFCGKYTDVTLFSTREFLYMEFVTRSGRVSFDKNSLDNSADFKFERRGFNISYEFSDKFVHLEIHNKDASRVIGTECDIRIRSTGGSNGTFKSPGYPSSFPTNTTCRFFLDGEMNMGRLEKVKVQFRDFFISGKIQNCTEGYLGVNYEGYRQTSQTDERFCGKLWPPELTSKDPRMILTFDTYGANSARFVASYRFLSDYAIPGKPIEEGRCMFLFESKDAGSGIFNSPRHPDNYPPNLECIYIFRPSKENQKLLISFDTFSLNNKSKHDHMCLTTDFLELYEMNPDGQGADRYYPVTRFCGQVYPAPIIATQEIKIRFQSYKDSSYQGFKARYEFLTNAQLHTACGKTIQSDGTGGLIKSPHYPQKYKSKTYCEWTILASKRENKILIQLESFKIEGEMPPDKGDKETNQAGKGCKTAVLRIKNGEELQEFCGQFSMEELSEKAFLSSGDYQYISFLTSSRALGAKGFRITWTEVHETGTCYGFKCEKNGYCISSELKCNSLPNCGNGDFSDEICGVGVNPVPNPLTIFAVTLWVIENI